MAEGRLLGAHQAAELQQHLLLQLPFLAGQHTDPVAQGDHGLGLDKHRAAGGGAVVDQAHQLGGGPGLDRQHRPAVALGHDRVLKEGAVATDQLLQAFAPVGAGGGQLAAQLGQGGTSPIGHPAPLLQAEAQPLLQLGQGAQVRHQGRGYGPDRGVFDLAAQAPGRRQGGGHGQQGQGRGGAALGAEEQGVAQVGHALEGEAPLAEAIEAEQLGGFGQAAAAVLQVGAQGQAGAEGSAGAGAGKRGQVLPQPGPFQELQGLLADGLVHPGRLRSPGVRGQVSRPGGELAEQQGRNQGKH